MPILDMQRRMRELGRIRTGEQVDAGNGRKRPVKLGTFRLTSVSREYIEHAAQVYGGTVKPWQSPRGPEWETTIESPTLEVIVPPGEAVDPWYELWRAGGCQRRCDGHTNILANEGSGGPCECPSKPTERMALAAKGEACKPTTRLNVMLPALPDLGVWRLESHSFYAAVELAGTVDTIRIAAERGVLVRARLRIDQRHVKRPNQPPHDFTVPVLELPDFIANEYLPEGAFLGAPRLGQGPAAPPPALPAGPPLPERSDFRAPTPTTASSPQTPPAASPPAAGGTPPDIKEGQVREAPTIGSWAGLRAAFEAAGRELRLGEVKGLGARALGRDDLAMLTPVQWDRDGLLAPSEWQRVADACGLGN